MSHGIKSLFTALHIGHKSGLYGMSSDSVEVGAMLSARLPKVKSCRETYNTMWHYKSLYSSPL
jgi:hypothetical protein